MCVGHEHAVETRFVETLCWVHMQCGADPEATDFNGQTALMVAVFSGALLRRVCLPCTTFVSQRRQCSWQCRLHTPTHAVQHHWLA